MNTSSPLFNPEENIISVLGLSDLPQEKRQAIIENATDLVMRRTLARIFDMLSPEDVEAINKLGDNSDAVMELIVGKVPNMAEVVNEEAMKVRDELKASIEA